MLLFNLIIKNITFSLYNLFYYYFIFSHSLLHMSGIPPVLDTNFTGNWRRNMWNGRVGSEPLSNVILGINAIFQLCDPVIIIAVITLHWHCCLKFDFVCVRKAHEGNLLCVRLKLYFQHTKKASLSYPKLLQYVISLHCVSTGTPWQSVLSHRTILNAGPRSLEVQLNILFSGLINYLEGF